MYNGVNITSASLIDTYFLSSIRNYIGREMYFKDNGTKLYAIGPPIIGFVRSYDLTSPYNVSTMTNETNNTTLKKNLALLEKKRIAEGKQQVKINDTKNKLFELQTQIKNYNDKIKERKTSINEYEKANESLNKQLKELEIQKKSIQKEITSSITEYKKLDKDIIKVEKDSTRYQDSVNRLNNEISRNNFLINLNNSGIRNSRIAIETKENSIRRFKQQEEH